MRATLKKLVIRAAAVLVSTACPSLHAADVGALVYSAGGEAVRFDLASRQVSSVPLAPKSTRFLGHAGGLVTEVDAYTSISARPDRYTVLLRSAATGAPRKTGELPEFEVGQGRLSGPVQPSPSGRLFAVSSRLQASLGEPFVDHVSVMDRSARTLLRVRGYRNPAWLGEDGLVVAGHDGLYLLAARSGSPQLTRIVAAAAPEWPSVAPDGRAIAFVQNDAVWRVGIDGQGLRRLTQPHVGQNWPAWSPDGARMLVVRSACPLVGAGIGAPELAIISASDTDQDLQRAPKVMRDGKAALRACGPVYWTR